MADDFGLKIGLEGEKEFKKALSEINQFFHSMFIGNEALCGVPFFITKRKEDMKYEVYGYLPFGCESPAGSGH